MVVHVARGDLTDMQVDALVSPANSQGIMTHGVAGNIRERGGRTIESEFKELAPVAVGAAIVTGGGELWCKAVIHAPTMEEPGLRVGVENVRRATRAALLGAARNEYATIAFPALGTGSGGVPFDEAARAMVDEIRAHKFPFPSTVWLIATTSEMIYAFEDALRLAAQP